MSRAASEPGTCGPPSVGKARNAVFDSEIRHGKARRPERNVQKPLHCALLMAVPKRKSSKARRDQRRATHALETPRVNTCPQCGSPKRAHRVCPTCGTYKGREVEPLRLQAP